VRLQVFIVNPSIIYFINIDVFVCTLYLHLLRCVLYLECVYVFIVCVCVLTCMT